MEVYEKQLTLGGLIDGLKKCSLDASVEFDCAFYNVVPSNWCGSYRGYYEQLALGYEIANYPGIKSNSELIQTLEYAVGSIFPGYKGGYYRMDRDTPMWASNYGDATGLKIVDVYEKYRDAVVIRTCKGE